MKSVFRLVPALVLISTACAPAQKSTQAPKSHPAPPSAPKAVKVTPEIPAVAPQKWISQSGNIRLEGVTFDSRTHRLQVLDQPNGPGSQWQDAAQAGASVQGLAAINAGFFTPEGKPLGLLMAAGKPAGSWNGASSLGSALWYRDGQGRSAIARREAIGRTAAAKLPELLQAGPLLVEAGKEISGLDPEKVSPRSFILWDGGHRWVIARSSPCSLAELSSSLAKQSPCGWPIRMALNLDGGRSSELWISSQLQGGPSHTRPLWNAPVRNFLVLRPIRE